MIMAGAGLTAINYFSQADIVVTNQTSDKVRARRTRGRDIFGPPSNLGLRLYEFEKIGVDHVCMRGRHPMRKALVDLQRAVL